MTHSVVITQANGTQGRTSYGPRTTESEAAGVMHEPFFAQQLLLDGDHLPTAVDFNDDTRSSLPAKSVIADVWVKASYTDGVTTIKISVEDSAATSQSIFAVLPVADTWVIVRDVDVEVALLAQYVVADVTAGETAQVIIRGLKPLDGDNGVLVRVS